MTVKRSEFGAGLDAFLDPDRMRDYCPNGLQVEGREEIGRVAFGVTASLALLERAAAWGADAVVVHHGLFWRGQGEVRVERSLRARLKALLDREMNLFGYHLPLDRHPEVGNNAVLARLLGAAKTTPAFEWEGTSIGLAAAYERPRPFGEFVAAVAAATRRDPLVEGAGPAEIRTFGVVTGGAARSVEEAARRGLDAFVTGEPSEAAVHLAREEGIHFVAAGHHATERFGVAALAEWVRTHYALETTIIEINNPV